MSMKLSETIGVGCDKADPVFSRKKAAAYIDAAEQTLASWYSSGRDRVLGFPAPIKVGRLCKYRKSDLDAFLARRGSLEQVN